MPGVDAVANSHVSSSFDLIDALLYTAAHDLKSPLLTLSLSADLMVRALPETTEQLRTAVDGLRHGGAEIERMLNSLAAVSRAYRRPLDGTVRTVRETLHGLDQARCAEIDDAVEGRIVAVDARAVAELLTVLHRQDGGEIDVRVNGSTLTVSAPAPESDYGIAESPLETLFASLTAHSGSVVQALAEVQVQLERQGGSVRFEDGRVEARLPLEVPA